MRECVYSIYSWEIEFIIFTMRGGVHNIFTSEMDSTAFSPDRWRPQYSLSRGGIQIMWTPWEVESTTFTHNIWNLHILYIRAGIDSFRRFLFPFIFITSPQHLQRRGGVHSIYDIWSPQHWLPIYWIHSIFSCEMEYTVYTQERLSS